jgi:thiaminase
VSLFGRTLWIIGLSLFIGAVPDAVMANYLIQDHRFLDSFLLLLGAALASADTFEARLRFGRFVGMVSAEENAVQTPGTVATERRSSQILWHSR